MSSQEIPAEAIEAAALIIYRTSGRKRVMSYEQARPQCESDAREILEAAAPHMLVRVQVGDVELIAPDVKRIGDTISYNGQLYVRDTPRYS